MITSVCKDQKITIDKSHLFDEFYFNKDDSKQQPPFSTNHIVNVLLNPDKLKGLSKVHQGLLKAFAETGVHVAELVGVQPDDIHLDEPIPHFFVKNKPKNKLKTKHRALEAFKDFLGGFSQLIKNVDKATSEIGSYLRENDLLEIPGHSTYSLRHSFQDRLTNEGCNDRIQTDLMGHAFKDRTKYGTGATLQTKYKWMKKIQLN
jgi:site-specific recombinase XerD